MVATPSDEIQRQHEEAVRLCCETGVSPEKTKANGMSMPMARVNHGEIPLTEKVHPPPPGCPVVSSRGQLTAEELSALVELVREGVENNGVASKKDRSDGTATKTRTTTMKTKTKMNLWDPKVARRHNVHIVRPSHDGWGIRKIVLVFCDDFLQKVYELPWWWNAHSHTDSSATNGNTNPTPNDGVAERMRTALEPVLRILGLWGDGNETRIVRMLLASMPPGVTIPVHYDTGSWVGKCHRVHVPVIVEDPSRVLFRCGQVDTNGLLSSSSSPSSSAQDKASTATMVLPYLDRVDVTPGHVFEMNNAAFHAVSNCGTTERVHLILDYVDDNNTEGTDSSLSSIRQWPGRIRLRPGERVRQTRRSLDREIDAGKTPSPSFVILGAQKAGTTSVYEMLMQHPHVVRPKRRETHALDWRWVDVDNNDATDNEGSIIERERASCRRFYHDDKMRPHPSLRTGDSTPSYLLHTSVVVPRMRRLFPWTRFVVCLRDPAARAVSHWRMATDSKGTPAQLQTRGTEWRKPGITLVSVIRSELRAMDQCGLIPYWRKRKNADTSSDAVMDTDMDIDMETFENFVGTDAEDEAWERLQAHVPLHTGSHSLVARGLYAVQLRQWFRAFADAPDRSEDEVREGTVAGARQFFAVHLERHLSTPEAAVSTMQRLYDFLELPSDVVPTDVSARNVREYPEDDDVREAVRILRTFYAPHNRRLRTLLEGPEWTDPWTYPHEDSSSM